MSNPVPPFLWSDEGTFAAPVTYEVPASGEVQPYTATATFDGTHAAGAFQPTISLYSAQGNLLGRVFPEGVTVAIGEVAEVSFIPPFGSTGGSGGPLTVTDGTHTVDPTTEIDFLAGALVTDEGGGVAGVTIVGPQAFVGARIYNSSVQSFNNLTNTDLVYDSIDSNIGMTVNLVANNRIITAISEGYYLVSTNIDYGVNATGRRIAILYKNGYYSIPSGTNLGGYATAALAGGGVTTPVGFAQVVHLAAGDFVSSGGYQDSGGVLNSSPGGEQNFLACALIGN